MRFLHTADLQLGSRFVQFGDKADLLRETRIATLRRVLDIARDKAVDAVLIAGDMFESNLVADRLLQEAFTILNAHRDVPVIILPGNHDPVNGPGCIWLRKPFSQPPAHVTVCTTRDAINLGRAVILPVPITQRISTKDPSLPLVKMAAAVPEDKIKIGITHGSPAIEGKHQPNDHPIALDAATRAGLDYLAIGHWHKPQVYDDGRLVMPGTPEPNEFDQEAGSVTLVEITAPGEKPRIEHVNSAALSWHCVALDLQDGDLAPDGVKPALAGIGTPPEQTILRVELKGALSPDNRAALLAHISEATSAYAIVDVVDKTTTVLSRHLWQAWLREHPLLAQVVADIDRARSFNTGKPPTTESEALDELTVKDFQTVCRELNLEDNELDDDLFESMMVLLTAEVSQVANEDAGT